VDQVTIQPDGKWDLHTKPEPLSKSNGVASDDDDDLIEVTKSGDSVRVSTPCAYGTPAAREPSSTAAMNLGSTSGKRPIAAVIDLTSSGDEDDEPLARPAKRQYNNGYGQPPGPSTSMYRPSSATYPR
jgi:E3 SUMO-protein ligase PIAS1